AQRLALCQDRRDVRQRRFIRDRRGADLAILGERRGFRRGGRGWWRRRRLCARSRAARQRSEEHQDQRAGADILNLCRASASHAVTAMMTMPITTTAVAAPG